MALVEAVLTYRPHSLASADSVPIGKTSAPEVLQALRGQLLNEAHQQIELWRDVDAGLAGMKMAEKCRLEKILDYLLPGEEQIPQLRILEEDEGPND